MHVTVVHFCMLSVPYVTVNCRLKDCIVLTFLDFFRNKSTAANLDQSRYTCTGRHMHRPTTFTKFWARLAKWGRNGGLKSVPTPVFFASNTR